MFAFNASGSSSSGASQSKSTRPASGKGGFVPSAYIKKQLELEEEARRQREQGETLNRGSLDAYAGGASGSPSTHWRGPEEVLAPGYHSGALGYQISAPAPSQPSFALKVDQEDPHRYSGGHSVRFDDGAGVGLGVQSARKESVSAGSNLYPDSRRYSNGSSRSSTFTDAPQGQSPFPGSTATTTGEPARKSIIRSESRADLGGGQGELQKKNSVRFTSAAKEMSSPRPGTPSVYSQGGSSSPFFTGLASSGSSIHSVSKEDDKIDIFGHRAAAAVGAQTLNSSLGPALGSVSGATQSSQIYSTPRGQGDMSMSSLRNTGFGATGPGSASFLGHDGSLRQSGKQGVTGNALGDDEEDKDKERYMPAVLLSYTPGLKGTKLEPFVDGKQDWDNDPFQSNSNNGGPRPPPHLVGEDAPPGESLDDIAHKEGYYSRPTSSLSQFRGPNQDTRSDSEMANASGTSIGVNASVTTRSEEPFDSIITYGFPPEAASYVLNQFRDFGSISRHETGSHGHKDDSFNWLKIQYTSAWSAKNACSRHLKAVGKFIVGVHPCRSFSNQTAESPSSMAMDTGASRDLTEAESREVGAGVDALLMMRTTGQDMAGSRDQTALAASARQASLAESWNQGSNGARASTFGQSLGFGESVSRKVDTSATTGDEDMAFILGHSLTSGGTIGRPRGRDLDREISGELLRSRSKDPQQQLGNQKSEKELPLGVSGLLEGSVMDSTLGELPSVGFRPLFGQNESRGLYNSTSGPSESLLLRSTTQQQQLQHQHQQEYQQRAEQQTQGASNAQMSWRRPLGDSTVSDNTLFSSSGGVLMSSSRVSSSLHVPKKQRLSSSLFSPVTGSGSAEAGPWMYSSGGSGVHGSFQLNRFGKDRGSLLIDDPALVDDLGRSIQSPGMSSVPGGISSPGSKVNGMNVSNVNSGYSVNGANRTQMPLNGANSGSSNGLAGQQGVAKEPESMIASAINMAKKRFFWG